MSKLTRQDKIQIYEDYKNGVGPTQLSLKYKINVKGIKYLIRLIKRHGTDILHTNRNKYYDSKIKTEIINKVLLDKQSINQVSVEYGLSSHGMLSNWIKQYKEANYVIVEKTRERSTMTKNINVKPYEEMTLEEKTKYLEKRNVYLEAENEYLKKLEAAIQKLEKQKQK